MIALAIAFAIIALAFLAHLRRERRERKLDRDPWLPEDQRRWRP
jgi:TRAP-type C4-dicarboxylate transport system permease small subunit